MTSTRLYIGQDALDGLLEADRCTLRGDELWLQGEAVAGFRLASAVRFLEVEVGEDAAGLLDRVLDLERLAERGGEHVAGSVLLGETAYRVQEGFLATPLEPDRAVEALAAARRWWRDLPHGEEHG